MATVSTVNLSAPMMNQSSGTAGKEKTPGFKECAQVVKPMESHANVTPISTSDGPKIITQIEASVLVTQTVNSDGTMAQFPRQGVVEFYKKSQDDLAAGKNLDILPDPSESSKV